jgi:hypothetical protein
MGSPSVGDSSCGAGHPNPTNRLSHPFSQPSTSEPAPPPTQAFQKALIKGYTLVPRRGYFGVRGYAKVSIRAGRGRNVGDQRQYLNEKDTKREMRNEQS